jgi:hypothetical protein
MHPDSKHGIAGKEDAGDEGGVLGGVLGVQAQKISTPAPKSALDVVDTPLPSTAATSPMKGLNLPVLNHRGLN